MSDDISTPPSWIAEANDSELYDLVPEAVKRAIHRFGESCLARDEKQIEETFSPTPLVNRIKVSFWKEFDQAKREGRKMKTANIVFKICSSNYFRDFVLHRPDTVAWLLVPPTEYMVELESMMDLAARRLREIISIPLTKTLKNGQEVTDLDAASLVLKAVKQLEDRVRGAPLQRQEQKQVQLRYEQQEQIGLQDVESKVKELEDKLKGSRLSILDKVQEAEVVGEDD